jgi:large subunit ribosomal protein L29
MKYSEIQTKDVQELQKELKEKRLQLFKLRMSQKTMQLQKTSEIRDTRKDIARIMTAINAKREQ